MNKVLIIDDDKELCALIKRSVLSEDIEADFCNTGKEGLQKLKEREYQLVILDVMMPGMDGFETLEEIRKESSLPILMFPLYMLFQIALFSRLTEQYNGQQGSGQGVRHERWKDQERRRPLYPCRS